MIIRKIHQEGFVTDIQKVESIAYEHAEELSKAGVLTTEDLLRCPGLWSNKFYQFDTS